MRTTAVILSLTAAHLASVDAAFGVTRLASVRRAGTVLNLEDHVAEMIDKELYRQKHLAEYEREWHEKNKAVMEPKLPTELDIVDDPYQEINRVVPIRDRRLADRDPQKYCADRCVGSGYCEVYEDMFDMTPEEVLAFCTDCVLSEGEEPCEIPERMLALVEVEDDLEDLKP